MVAHLLLNSSVGCSTTVWDTGFLLSCVQSLALVSLEQTKLPNQPNSSSHKAAEEHSCALIRQGKFTTGPLSNLGPGEWCGTRVSLIILQEHLPQMTLCLHSLFLFLPLPSSLCPLLLLLLTLSPSFCGLSFPSLSKPSSMPVSKASVGSGGFWAAEGFAPVLVSHICNHSWYPQPDRKVPDHLLTARRAVAGEHLLWGLVPAGGNLVVDLSCAHVGSCWCTWWRMQMKWNALFLVRRGFLCAVALLPALTSICFISCCAGSPTSKLSSVCQASHGSPVSKTHGSSFGTSAVKVMFSLGVCFSFKVQLAFFLALKILHFRQLLGLSFPVKVYCVTDGAIGEHGGYTRW